MYNQVGRSFEIRWRIARRILHFHRDKVNGSWELVLFFVSIDSKPVFSIWK